MDLTLLDLTEAKQKAMADRGPLSLQRVDDFSDIFVGMQSATGEVVSRERALRVSTVLACIRVLMEDVASLPLQLKKKTKDGAILAEDHPLYPLLYTSPNPFQTSVELREHMIMDMLLDGHFANWSVRSRGTIEAIYPLSAAFFTFSRQVENVLFWNYGGPEVSPREFSSAETWRGTIMGEYIVFGRSLVLLAKEAIGLAMAAEKQGARLFKNGIQTDLALKTAGTLDTEQRTLLRKNIDERHAGVSNSWRPLLLEGGLDATRISLTAVESQFLEARQYQLTDIARIFRIPSVLLGIETRTSAYASAEQFFQSYVKHTLRPWAVRLEQTIQRDLLTPDEQNYFAEHDFSSLLRADQLARYQAYQIGIGAKFMVPNQVRRLEGWEEIEGLDEQAAAAQALPSQSSPPPGGPATPATPGNPPADDPANDDEQARRQLMAERFATAALRREVRFYESGNAVMRGNCATFWSNHRTFIRELTGCDADAARQYTDSRVSLETKLLLTEQVYLDSARVALIVLAMEQR